MASPATPRFQAVLVAVAALALGSRALASGSAARPTRADAGRLAARDGGSADREVEDNLDLLQNYDLLRDMELVTPSSDAGSANGDAPDK